MSEKNITFILHKPQLSENIGACARAIKNFNFKKLVLINPKPIFPNDKILATSVGAKDIINQSKKHDNLEKALGKIDILIATSARFRNKNIKHINLEDLKKINFKKRVGFLFGSEASGLSNEEVSYANYTLQIPTNPDFKSLNLSHSLIIIAQYVANLIKLKNIPFKKSKKVKSASKKEIQSMNGGGLLVYAIQKGMIGKSSVQRNRIGEVKLKGDIAKGQIVSGEQITPVYFDFNKEKGVWKIDLTSVFSLGTIGFKQVLKKSGLKENEYLIQVLEQMNGKKPSTKIWNPNL